MRNSARIAALLLALPGLAAPFLSFVDNESPLDTMLPGWLWGRAFSLLGAPFFLAIPIALWQARTLFAGRPSHLEIVTIYVLSTSAMISVLAFTILRLTEGIMPTLLEALAMFVLCWTLIIANILLLARNVSRHIGHEASAEIFLLGSYLPNAVLCLIGFGWDRWSHLQAGAWVVLTACIAYFVAIALALRTANTPGSPKAVP